MQIRRHAMTSALAALAIAVATAFAPAAAEDAKSKDGGVTIVTPWARATPGGAKIGAAYFEVTSKAGDAIVSASSPVAGKVELHTHVHDNGVMRMREVEAIDVPAGGKVALKPGGFHLMMMDLKKPLKEGDTIDLTLVMRKAGEINVKVPVLKVGSPGPGAGHHGAHGKH